VGFVGIVSLYFMSKIFLDSGDPAETKEIINLLGYLDGQTTNPSLFAKNPQVQEKLARGEKFSATEVYEAYKKIVQEISSLIPGGSVSVEVYADKNTSSAEMLKQAHEMNTWIPNAHIKLPITAEGLKTAQILVSEGINVNLTLVFSQAQAAAVYAATKGAKPGQVFLSPFIGRFDDRGEDGMTFIQNVLEMYKLGDGHVEVLSASVRTYEHLLCCLKYESDIITVPRKVLKQWEENGQYFPDDDWQYDAHDLKPIIYQDVSLNKPWTEYDIEHDLTDKGLEKFASDWDNLIA
jgi:transaldolase